MKKILIIVDANALLHRAFHALPSLTNKKGQPTGAVYGFLLTLFKAIKDLQANYVVACFDTKAATFRRQVFEDYKAHRPPTPNDLVSQLSVTKEVLQSFNIPVFAKDGFEADDLIATIAEKAAKECQVYIVSGDLDNLQLVNENVKMYTLGRGIKDTVIYDKEKVIERFGVTPLEMNDFKALIGDPSDNIPGVRGVGKTTAEDLIKRYNSIENLYAELSTDTAVLKPKVKEALKTNKESAFLSLRLLQTIKDVPLEFNLESCRFGQFDKKNVERIFQELNFTTLLARLSTITF